MSYRILSLDGGGSWSLIQAYCLGDLFGFDKSGHEILANFDLAVANSGGSLVLAGLIARKTPNQIIDMIKKDEIRNSIFKKKWYAPFSRCFGIGPKYSAKDKLKGIRDALGKDADLKITDIPETIKTYKGKEFHFVIMNFDYRKNRAFFHRSNLKSKADSHYCELFANNGQQEVPIDQIPRRDTSLAEAVHGASNAPVNFFDEPALVQIRNEDYVREMWDGAVGGYNNPVLAGVIEALVNDEEADKIKILSIGTGNNELLQREGKTPSKEQEMFYVDEKKSSLISDIPKLAKSILNDPPDAASYHAYCMLGMKVFDKNERFFRMNPLVKPIEINKTGVYRQPEGLTPEDFKALSELEMDATETTEIALIEKFANAWMTKEVPNQPLRNNKSEAAIIGHINYKDVKKDFIEHFFK